MTIPTDIKSYLKERFNIFQFPTTQVKPFVFAPDNLLKSEQIYVGRFEPLMAYIRLSFLELILKREDYFFYAFGKVDHFLKTDFVNTFIRNQLVRLLRVESLIENSKKLTKEKALLGNALIDKNLELKLQGVIVRVLRSPFIRTRARDVFLNFMKSPTGQEIFTKNISDALQSKALKEQIVGSVKSAIPAKESKKDEAFPLANK